MVIAAIESEDAVRLAEAQDRQSQERYAQELVTATILCWEVIRVAVNGRGGADKK